MNGFRGRFTARGAFVHADGPHDVPCESHLGCEVLARGYLAERPALRARFATGAEDIGDARLLAHAFRAWGRDLQAHVYGQFAVAIWDVRARTGLLTHDALGLEPLFYARRDGDVLFATDLVDLLDARTVAELDDEYLADFFACGAVATERTPYRSVRRLLPGRSLWWADGELRELHTWDLAGVEPATCGSDAEYEERFRDLLEAGVRGTLDAPGGAGIALSGGLDSSTVACVAARTGRPGVAAYSILAPRWPDADERRWMRAVVDACGLPWRTCDIESVLPFARLPDEFLGEPAASVVDEERRRVFGATLAADGVGTLLTGDGGDYVLCAASGAVPRHLADPLFEGNALRALRDIAQWKAAASPSRSYTYWFLRALVRPALDHARAKRVRSAHIPLPGWFDADYARTTDLDGRSRRRVAPPCRQPGRQAVWDDLWIGALGASGFPRKRTAYEIRKPLLHLPLVEFMAAIPWEQKVRPRCDRYLQRRALRGVLPELVRRRATKSSGTAPFVEGLRRSRDWFAYLTDAPLMAERGIVDRERWREAVRQAAVGQTNSDKYFLAGVAVEAWLRQLSGHRIADAA